MLNQTIHTHYKVIKPLGSGAFGQTYLAQNLQLLDQPFCVVKQLKLHNDSPTALKTTKEWFIREVEALRQLGQHEQIPQILDSFEEEHEFYLVQEYVEGKTFREELSDRTLWHELQAVAFLQEVLPILEFIHSRGIIHRDIKPENIIRRASDRKLFLIDFGAVKQISSGKQKRTSLTIVHSRGYSAPEQLVGIPEPNSDIYSLGMTCIEALTGVTPELLAELRNPQTRKIQWSKDSSIRDEFRFILDQMVCIDSQKRHSNASHVIQALGRLNQITQTQNISSQWTPTDITFLDESNLEQVVNSQPYTPTEISIRHLSTNDLEMRLNEDLEQPPPSSLRSSSSHDQSKKILSSKQLSDELNEHLKQSKITSHTKIQSNIAHLLKRKSISFAGSLALITAAIFFWYASIQADTSSVSQSSQLLNSKSSNGLKDLDYLAFEEQSSYTDHSSSIKFLEFTSNGKTLVSGSEAGVIKLRDLQSQSVKVLTQAESKLLAIASSHNGKFLAIATEAKAIELWDLKNSKKINQILTEQLTWSLALSSDGQTLAAGKLGTIRLWRNLQQVPKLLKSYQFDQKQTEPIKALSFNSTTNMLVAGSADGTIAMFDSAHHKLQTSHKHLKAINSITTSVKGDVLFTASEDDTIRIWDVGKLEEPTAAIQADVGGVQAIASSADGKTLAGGGSYGIVKLWHWSTGRLIASFSNHSIEITALAFSSDGQMFAAGDRDGKIVIYGLSKH